MSCRATVIRAMAIGGIVGTFAASSALWAAPGDLHRVSGAELVNLRAGPSDSTNVRGRVNAGDEVIELTRSGNWVGVRVLDNGQEGWIYEGLLDRVAASGLAAPSELSDAGFLKYSESFDQLLRRINNQLGYPVVDRVDQLEDGTLRVTPTSEWLIDGSRDAHLMSTAAIYQMWKNYQNSAPVAVAMTDRNDHDYIVIRDTADGPSLAIAQP